MNQILQQRIEEASVRYCQDKNYMLPLDTEPSMETITAMDAFVKGTEWLLEHMWISVDEALPEKEQYVLVAVLDTIKNEYNYGFDAVTDSTEVVTDEHGFRIWADTDRITHWMMIPELPKGGEK